jgi:hypothetical protein
MLIFCLPGCGSSQPEVAAKGTSLNRQILQLEQGASVDLVKEKLGEPDMESGDGVSEGLGYGIWQLTFVHEHLTMRSKVLVPSNGPPSAGGRSLSKKILQLSLGTKIGVAEENLGTPETVYLIYENEPQPTKVLRYGPWELTFVHGELSQRAR